MAHLRGSSFAILDPYNAVVSRRLGCYPGTCWIQSSVVLSVLSVQILRRQLMVLELGLGTEKAVRGSRYSGFGHAKCLAVAIPCGSAKGA